MWQTHFVVILAFAAVSAHSNTGAPKQSSKPSCQDFSRGVSFNDSQAVGTWHLLHYSSDKTNSSAESHCVKFSLIDDKERKDLSERIGRFLSDMKWEKLALKMQIPCPSAEGPGGHGQAGQAYRGRDYYLEKIGPDDGSYRTLQMPPVKANTETSDFHQYPMRLKTIEGQYLGMMDCHEKFVFLLGQQPPRGQLDEHLRKMIETYWPEDH